MKHSLKNGALNSSLVLRVAVVAGLIFWFHAAVWAGSRAASNSCQVASCEGLVTVSLKDKGRWEPARPEQVLVVGDSLKTGAESRATLLFADLSVLRVNELTLFSILPPPIADKKPMIDLKIGSVYFFSRQKPADVEFRTPTASGAIRGTEFELRVSEEETIVSLIDGVVDLENETGRIRLVSGEQGQAIRGAQLQKKALVEAINVIQWCLYYPAVIDLNDLNFDAQEELALASSLRAYRAGDLPGALAAIPEALPLSSDSTRVYRAELALSVGNISQAQQLLTQVDAQFKPADAIGRLIAAVQKRTFADIVPPATASQWLAHSYYLQSQGQVVEALKAARQSVKLSPGFGFGWVRTAELEFSLGRVPEARRTLAEGLRLSPRNAQALAVSGFIYAAQNRVARAIQFFDQAIAVDGALANAWLGRGLCRIHEGMDYEGLRDIQVACALEPQRALLRSYLSKAFDNFNKDALAEKESRLAKELDPNDPTSWFYDALIKFRQNRVTEAISDLNKSKELNDNRSLFRSRLLLDQDQAVRSANLASIYRDAGMIDTGVDEANLALSQDYANYSAHLFLADSYDALRDPKIYNLRYETPAATERTVANLLAPVGSETLAQSLAGRDYTPLFVKDGLGLSSSTEYSSTGGWTQEAAQYGREGSLAYSVYGFYRNDPGQRPNNDFEQEITSVQTKVQLTQQDSIDLEARGAWTRAGDIIQYYDQNSYNRGFRVNQHQTPDLYFGGHHEWSPGVHTLYFAGRLDSEVQFVDPDTNPLFFYMRNNAVSRFNPAAPPFSEDYKRSTELFTGELQQIWEGEIHSLVVGLRYQTGESRSTAHESADLIDFSQDVRADVERQSYYGYYQWTIWQPLTLTFGAAYDVLSYPVNLVYFPVTDQTAVKSQLSPKVGAVFTPSKDTVLRVHYTRSLGDSDGEKGIGLEPTTVAGLNQSFRGLIPEAVAGPISASQIDSTAAAINQTLWNRTFLSLKGELLSANADRVLGVLTNHTDIRIANQISQTHQLVQFKERNISFNADQLLSRNFNAGVHYRLSDAHLDGHFPAVPSSARGATNSIWDQSAVLNQVTLYLNFNHSSGFFSQFQSLWIGQLNDGYGSRIEDSAFWQHNIFAGYRFFKRRATIQAGILNLAGTDYQLNPLNFYCELPRKRTVVVKAQFNF